MATIIQLRRDSAANWTSVDPTLAEGEMGIETDTLRLKIGNGVDEWTALPYYTTPGGVTSVAMSVPTGLEVTGSPITSTGTFAITFATGYSIPTTAKQADWDSAFGWGNHASAGYLDSADIGVSVLAYDSDLASFLLSFTLPTVDGTAGQALVTDGSGSLSFTDFPSGLPAIGSDGQVLTVVSGEPEWANNPAGFSNPMTTAGDLIVGDTGGTATRLAAGTDGQVLSIVAGEPSWETPAGGGDGVPIGGYVFVQTNLTGAEEPDSAKYIKLTAGLTGSGQYNEGKLTSESVTGSAPLVVATAVIDDAGSPMNGQTVNLINTENRYIMPGTSAGTVANDQMQQITGSFTTNIRGNLSTGSGAFSVSLSTNDGSNTGSISANRTASFDSANSPGARTGDHTNVKHIQVTAYMRIK